jgi:site-specific DNA recombinase
MVHTHTRKGDRLYRYYVCLNAQQRGWNICATRSVSAPEIEQAVLDQIRDIGKRPELIDAVLRELEKEDPQPSTRNRRDLKRVAFGLRCAVAAYEFQRGGQVRSRARPAGPV